MKRKKKRTSTLGRDLLAAVNEVAEQEKKMGNKVNQHIGELSVAIAALQIERDKLIAWQATDSTPPVKPGRKTRKKRARRKRR